MTTLRVIIGLPGSGKTLWAEQNCPGFTTFHDPGFTCTPKDILQALMRGESVAITDPLLCDETNRTGFCNWGVTNIPGIELEWVYFKNEPEVCLQNSLNRDRSVACSIHNLTKLYNPPQDALPCWRP